MHSFNINYINRLTIPAPVSWLLGSCMESRGKQELWKQTKPEVLEYLREGAIIQSAESSNRIEGVEVAISRLHPLLIGQSAPRDRSEEEVLGYRRALDFIFANFATLEIRPETVLKLHLLAQGGSSGDAGTWKLRNNEIVEISPTGHRTIRFVPVPPEQTAETIDQLCLGFRQVMTQQQLPDLVAIASFILDFLCIHPFRDGNGRVSRLLTLLLLQQSNYDVGRFVSLERLVEASKERYYETLKLSSEAWHQGQHSLMPFLSFLAAIVKEGYTELDQRLKLVAQSSAVLSDIVAQQILAQSRSFSLKDIKQLSPTVSEQLIKKVLYELKAQKKVALTGKGRAAKWQIL